MTLEANGAEFATRVTKAPVINAADPDACQARWVETEDVSRTLAEGLCGLGFNPIQTCANVLICRLPSKLPDAGVLVSELAERGLLIADAAKAGLASDARTVAITVKDRDTNLAMLEILRARLSETSQPKFSLSSALLHDL